VKPFATTDDVALTLTPTPVADERLKAAAEKR
jgi:hypothetical protein